MDIIKLLFLARHPVTILPATQEDLRPSIHLGGSSLVGEACSVLHREALLLRPLLSLGHLLDAHPASI